MDFFAKARNSKARNQSSLNTQARDSRMIMAHPIIHQPKRRLIGMPTQSV
jgi:hypothetical protein